MQDNPDKVEKKCIKDNSGYGKEVLLGFSGGIDSFVAALLLKGKGYNVQAIHFIFSDVDYDVRENLVNVEIYAKHLNIPFSVVDLREVFSKRIIAYFLREYELGRTPFPCAVCNPDIKFHYLQHYALKNGCSFIATGHYAQITPVNDVYYVKKGVDFWKDQSFFLWGLSSQILERTLFPLGKLHKKEVKTIARQQGVPALERKDESRGICFIEGNDYRTFLRKYGCKGQPGNFIDGRGNILGIHSGFMDYTIGQRRGLGINANSPLFVSEIRPETHEVVIGDYAQLYKTRIFIQRVHFIHPGLPDATASYIVKIRYRLQETPCRVEIMNDRRALLILLEPLAMVAPGQAAVLYSDDRVVGGGFIERAE